MSDKTAKRPPFRSPDEPEEKDRTDAEHGAHAPNTASPSSEPLGVVSPDGMPTREPPKAEAEVEARANARDAREDDALPPTDRPTHLHPGPQREAAPARNAMMSEPGQKPSNTGRFALIVVAVIAIAVIVWLV